MSATGRRSVMAAMLSLGAVLWLGTASAAEAPQNLGLGFEWSSSIPNEPSHGQPSPWIGGRLDLNMATAEELATLPGIGWDRALAIRDYRDQNGPYASVDELSRVPGMGASELDGIRDHVRVAR